MESGLHVTCLTASLIAFFIGFFQVYSVVGMWVGFDMSIGNNSDFTGAKAIVLIFLIMMVMFSLTGSTLQIKEIMEAKIHAKYLYYFVDYENQISTKVNYKDISLDNLSISVHNLDFKYDENEDRKILDNINVKFESSKITAIVGQSGSGKSTLVKLITRFYDPLSGHIEWNNVDIKDIDVNKLRSTLGYVNQEPVFFNISLRDNMKIVDENISDEEILKVLFKCDLSKWYKTLKYGLDTELGTQGSKLSGGQKQRLALARIFLKKNLKLLILDEATAALDYNTEKLIYQTIFEFQRELKFTCIIVAHRLKSIKKSDFIYVFHEGKVHEYGSHDELILKHGLY